MLMRVVWMMSSRWILHDGVVVTMLIHDIVQCRLIDTAAWSNDSDAHLGHAFRFNGRTMFTLSFSRRNTDSVFLGHLFWC